jgi:hypothetical protein
MVDFFYYFQNIVMLSFLEQVGVNLELMGEVRPLVWIGFFLFLCFHSYVKFLTFSSV